LLLQKQLLTNKLILSTEKLLRQKVNPAKPVMTLKKVFRKSRKPNCQQKMATKKESNYDLRYEIKTVTKKSTSQQQPQKAEAYKICPSPQQQKIKML